MGKLSHFSITLNKQIPIYNPAEIIDGTVNLNVVEKLKISKKKKINEI